LEHLIFSLNNTKVIVCDVFSYVTGAGRIYINIKLKIPYKIETDSIKVIYRIFFTLFHHGSLGAKFEAFHFPAVAYKPIEAPQYHSCQTKFSLSTFEDIIE
jgi:hypothetical protein